MDNELKKLIDDSNALVTKITEAFTKLGPTLNITALRLEAEEVKTRYVATEVPPPDFDGMLTRLASANTAASSTNSSSHVGSVAQPKPVLSKCEQYTGEHFLDWLKAFENFLFLNNISDEEYKIRYLLAYIGQDYARKLRKAIANVEGRTYQFVKTEAIKRFNRVDPFAANVALMQRTQKVGESTQDYAAELQQIAENCQLKETEEDTILKNRFASGLRNERIKMEVYTKKPKNFWEAVEFASAAELLIAGVAASSNGPSSSSSGQAINQIKSKKFNNKKDYKKNKDEKKPKGSGGKNQSGSKKNDKACFVCGKTGHFARECRHKKNTNSLEEEVGHLSIDNVTKGVSSSFTHSNGKILASFCVAGKEVVLEVDTGSPVNVLSWAEFRKIDCKNVLRPTTATISSASGHSMEIVGKRAWSLREVP